MLSTDEKSFVMDVARLASKSAVKKAIKCLNNSEMIAHTTDRPVIEALHMLVDALGGQDLKKDTISKKLTDEMIEKVETDLFSRMLDLIAKYGN